jgi:cytochrome c oxidase subunit 2
MSSRVHTYERAFLVLSALMLVVFLAALGYAAFEMGFHLPSPDAVQRTPPFDEPGVRQVGPGRYEAVVLARAWGFTPAEIRVPVGAEVTFRATSIDVVHGFLVEGTRINMMLLPGQISELAYTFHEPGEHLLICHEYCGVGHQAMFGKVIAE